MPDWRDEMKAELADLSAVVHAVAPTGNEFKQLIALVSELIDHVPDDPRWVLNEHGQKLGFEGYEGINHDLKESK